MPDNFTFEAASLQDLARELRDSALRVRGEVDKTLALVAEDIKVAAKAEASRYSKSIPPTIRARMVPGAAVVSAGGGDNALAAAYELGNKGRGGRKRDKFKHPLFGMWEYPQEQERHPFLRPALTAMRRRITKRMEAAWDEALRPLKLE